MPIVGCREECNNLFNWYEKHKGLRKFDHICQVRTCVVLLIEAVDNDQNDELDEDVQFIIEVLDEPEDEEDASELDA